MDKVKHSLEDKLERLRGPAIPVEVEARIRRRLQTEATRPPSKVRRFGQRVSPGQLALLLVLLLLAGWVVCHEVVPVLRDAWERAHCPPDSGAKRP